MATDKQQVEPIQQTERAESYILQQCLNVITTFPEFSNLTYRMSRTIQDEEVMTVYRDRLLGVFGAAVEPITLTIDPSGRCLVSVLFKPAQRVSLVSGNTGGLDILSLLAVLRMIAGKGFLFCPGIPQKILTGKACGRYIESHRAPFKRFQSPRCPVYYQMPTEKANAAAVENNMKVLPTFKMCPQCHQVASLVLKLPLAPMASRGAAAATVSPMQSDQKLLVSPVASDHTIQTTKTLSGGGITHTSFAQIPLAKPALLSLPTFVTNPSEDQNSLSGSLKAQPDAGRADLSQQQGQQGCSSEIPTLKRSNSDPQGRKLSRQGTTGTHPVRSEITNEALRMVLLRKLTKQDPSLRSSKSKDSAEAKRLKNKKSNRNTCRICKRNFSSPANLLNHLQRHEGVSSSVKKSLKSKMSSCKYNSSLATLRMMVRGPKSRAFYNKNNSAVSETSLRLFIKCLNNLVGSGNGSTIAGLKKYHAQDKKSKVKSKGTEESRVGKSSDIVVNDTKGVSDAGERPGLYSHRPSGLSAMQTLLEAATIAGINSGCPTVEGNHEQEAKAYSSSPKLEADFGDESKTYRKSSRIASRLKKKEFAAKDSVKSQVASALSLEPQQSRTQQELAGMPHEPAHLTNLDLLSSVSLKMEKRKAVKNLSGTLPVMVGSTFSLPSPPSSVQTFSQSISSNISVNTSTQINDLGSKTFDSGTSPSAPPPLLFAGSVTRALAQLQGPEFTTNVVHPSGTAVLASTPSECGAMDLSKPKPLTDAALPDMMIPVNEQQIVSDTEPPAKFLKLLSSGDADTIPVDLLTNSTMQQHKPSPTLPKLPDMVNINKISDANLQSRMFASARDYKVDRKASSLSASPVQAMIASRGSPVSKGGSSQLLSDEIHCGYKWSGSGGQVKERTQMVRELVPLDVMANYLNRKIPQKSQPLLAHSSFPKHQDSPALVVSPDSKGLRPLPRLVIGPKHAFLPQQLKSLPKLSSQSSPPVKSNEQMSLHVALNLTTPKQKNNETSPKQTSSRSKRKKGSQASQTPQQHTATTTAANLRSSIATHTSTTEDGGQNNEGQNSTIASTCNYSSPSLAAMLRLPAMSSNENPSLTPTAAAEKLQETRKGDVVFTAKRQSRAITPADMMANSNSHVTSGKGEAITEKSQTFSSLKPPVVKGLNSSSKLIPAPSVSVKSEPDNASFPPKLCSVKSEETVILSLPVTNKRRDSQTSMSSSCTQTADREGSESPGNLVMDLQVDTASSDGSSQEQHARKSGPSLA
ncbi:hypothetical protein PoB_006676300 [Plakobranchus ocellatus]|uniref:C2H2-type domain-containing protein n=1 Tax=Plakobranchus ocellatus TaxID=259542 RepID=A0AAV4D7R1_9GAST|nr:hypothetical protein PoB_006676300 [Plakobranchus ocellatus]